MTWTIIEAPSGLSPPRPITVRAQSIPGRHYFPEHDHRWNQLVYAISGVLTVAVEGRSFVISPPVGPHLLLTSQARSKLVSLVDLFNSASIDAFTTQHSEDVLFSTPTWRSTRPEGTWGRGLAAFRSDVLRYRQTFGPMQIIDVFPAGDSVSVLVHDNSGNRTEFCLTINGSGLVTRAFAFDLSDRPVLARD